MPGTDAKQTTAPASNQSECEKIVAAMTLLPPEWRPGAAGMGSCGCFSDGGVATGCAHRIGEA
jgi:hypothetical protein